MISTTLKMRAKLRRRRREEEQPVITVQEALRDALYIVSLEPVVKACIVCPGKLLKGAKMVELHRTSNAHERRVKLFKTLASKANPKENAWDLLREDAEKKPTPSLAVPSDDSKRAQKRKAHAALRKERRDKQKAKTRAKKAKAVDPSAPEPQTIVPQPTKPPQKKQKVATSSPAPHLPTRSPPEKASASIKSIARSASDRAKMARARAGNVKPKRTPKVAVS
ncbi:hypothetical protein FPV67DRAFT_902873 [Lyophyllum atratum]|nr:hypothetical protein FPV67DRAFT_902873 [Lyophyllum atratum]